MECRYLVFGMSAYLMSWYVCAEQQVYAPIKTLLDQYKRPITILEVGDHAAEVALPIAQQYNKSTVVTILTNSDRAQEIVDGVVARDISNVVVMNPPVLEPFSLTMLGKCEHFDVVIAHDIGLLDKDMMTTMRNILQLGDHAFVILSSQEVKKLGTAIFGDVVPVVVPLEGDKFLYCFETPKTNLMFSRWAHTMHDQDKLRNYAIKSDFSEKKLCKATGESSWLKGINLVTFIMLQGIFPTDKMIRQSLRSFKYIDHNDLVVANMIVQGSAIIPIDFKDKRRNIDPRICVKAARKVFNRNRRSRDPQEVMKKYVEYINKHKRVMPERFLD